MIIDCYLTDLITLRTVSKDEWGVSTNSDVADIKARVELGNRYLKNVRGEEVIGKGLILLRADQTITYETRIKIQTINGSSYNRPEKEFSILSLEKAHGFTSSHYEVIIG